MTLHRLLCLVVLAAFSSVVLAQTKVAPTPAFEQQVTALTALLSDGYAEEFKAARTYHFVDIFGHGRKDVVTFFTLEGQARSIYYGFYMAVFENVELIDPAPNEPSRYRLVSFAEVGGKGWRDVDFKQVKFSRSQIKLRVKYYAERDPMCCPTKSGLATYQIRGAMLQERR